MGNITFAHFFFPSATGSRTHNHSIASLICYQTSYYSDQSLKESNNCVV